VANSSQKRSGKKRRGETQKRNLGKDRGKREEVQRSVFLRWEDMGGGGTQTGLEVTGVNEKDRGGATTCDGKGD